MTTATGPHVHIILYASGLALEVVLYCQSGGRSNVAGNALVERGYCSLHQLTGGRSAWSAAGFAFE